MTDETNNPSQDAGPLGDKPTPAPEQPASVRNTSTTDEHIPQLVEPALTVTYQKVRLHPEDIIRVLTDKLPGYIPFFTQTGANFPGCRLIHFDAFGIVKGLEEDVLEHFKQHYPQYGSSSVVDSVNKFFACFANYYRANEVPDGQGGLFLYYSSILNEEDTNDLQDVAMANNKAINEKRAKRNADMAAAKEAKEKEHNDLLTLARAVRDAGGVEQLITSLRANIVTLEEENKKLSKKIRKSK